MAGDIYEGPIPGGDSTPKTGRHTPQASCAFHPNKNPIKGIVTERHRA
jgi:hypothetical protein